jgi:hypothetical protein
LEGNTPLEQDDINVVVVVGIIHNTLSWRYLDILITLRIVKEFE